MATFNYIAAFDLTPENMPMGPRLYRCALQLDAGL